MLPLRFVLLFSFACLSLISALRGQSSSATGTATAGGASLSSSATTDSTLLPPDQRDSDGDGLSDWDELHRTGSDVDKPDTDGDGVLDPLDGWPRVPWLSPAPLPEVRYVGVRLRELGLPDYIDTAELDDQGRLLGYDLANFGSGFLFNPANGSLSPVPVLRRSPDEEYSYIYEWDHLRLPFYGAIAYYYLPGFSDRMSGTGYVAGWEVDAGSKTIVSAVMAPDGTVRHQGFHPNLLPSGAKYMAEAFTINRSGQSAHMELGYLETDPDAAVGFLGGYVVLPGGGETFMSVPSPGPEPSDPVSHLPMTTPETAGSQGTLLPRFINDAGIVAGHNFKPGPTIWNYPNPGVDGGGEHPAVFADGTLIEIGPSVPGGTAWLSGLTNGITPERYPIVAVGATMNGQGSADFCWWSRPSDDNARVWTTQPMQVWDSVALMEAIVSGDRMPHANDHLEITAWNHIIRNGVMRPLNEHLPSGLFVTETKDINARGIILAEAGAQPVLLVPASLSVDANRDGTIDDKDLRHNTASSPFRFWSNDDDDSGDISATGPSLVGNPDEPGRLSGFWELDGRTPDHNHAGVDGRCDLLDFFPVILDINQLLGVLPHTAAGITYKLKQADSALSFVYTNLTRAESFDYLKYNKERVAYGLPSDQKKAHEAPTVAITAAGAPLDADFLTRIKNDTSKGVILIEGKLATDKPLRLVVEKGGAEIAEVSLNLKISEVEKMYRWVNLRATGGQSVTRQTDLSEPTGYPDSVTSGKMFIFVHGYNVNERQSRAWNAEAFKRMFQSGSRAMFTAVSWNGDHSQIPYVGVAPDYWDNITRSFKTAQALAPVVNGLPGSSKVIAGHSMGNVVCSSAIVDHGMNVAKYLVVNAAVALEAYDTSALAVDAMRNPDDWPTYERRLWPTDWFKLFPSGDGRRGLTWMDRFGNIPNAVNIYSSGEEVLNNNDQTPGEIPNVLSAERVWVIQEMAKGTLHLAALLTFDIQGGWGYNSAWLIAETQTTGGPHGGTTTTYRRRDPTEAAALTDDQLRAEPFFRPFKNDDFTRSTSGSTAATDLVARADALGGAIPALSFPAGGNAVPAFTDRNFNMMSRQDGWPQERLNDETARVPNVFPYQGRWFHSDIKNIAYVFNRGAWELFVTEGMLK